LSGPEFSMCDTERKNEAPAPGQHDPSVSARSVPPPASESTSSLECSSGQGTIGSSRSQGSLSKVHIFLTGSRKPMAKVDSVEEPIHVLSEHPARDDSILTGNGVTANQAKQQTEDTASYGGGGG
jgi:hypothetical protein